MILHENIEPKIVPRHFTCDKVGLETNKKIKK